MVIPCYCCENSIARAIQSVAAQTVLPREVIAVDDGSTDSTRQRLRDLQRRFGADWLKVLEMACNVGAASARNAAWEASRGRYLAFLDADDAWHPAKVEVQHRWMECHPDVVLTCHASERVGAGREPATRPLPRTWRVDRVGRAAMLVSNRVETPTAMVRRDIPQRFVPGLRYSEDYSLWLEVVLSGQTLARLRLPLAYVYKRPFGEGGLSARMWEMEKGEMATYRRMCERGLIPRSLLWMLLPFSLTKYLRRVAVVEGRRALARAGRRDAAPARRTFDA